MKPWIPKFKYIPPRRRERERPALRLPLYEEQTPIYSQEDEEKKEQEANRGVIIIQM